MALLLLGTDMRFLVIFFLAPVIAIAQQVITIDPRFDQVPDRARRRLVIDITNTNTATQPDYEKWMRNHPTPGLLDLETRIGVIITGTVADAATELRAKIKAARPAKDRLENRDAKMELQSVRDKLTGQGTQAQRIALLESEVSRLTEIVEYLLESSETRK